MAKGSMVARAHAAAMLRQRREADALPELIGIWREWLRIAFPEYADSIADLPDEAFRRTEGGEATGFGQDPDEVRRLFMELVEGVPCDDADQPS